VKPSFEVRWCWDVFSISQNALIQSPTLQTARQSGGTEGKRSVVGLEKNRQRRR
jgi:hypothetical protein